MNVVVMGTGFVGLTHAAVLAERGHRVVGCDSDPRKVAAFSTGRPTEIHRFVHEPGLAACVGAGLERRLLRFTTDVAPALGGADALFLCLPTPEGPGGGTDLDAYHAATSQLIRLLRRGSRTRRLTVVNKSTVPIGTTRQLHERLRALGIENVGVASNPEFLPQGDAVEASRRPSRVVIGATHPGDFAALRALYAPSGEHVRLRIIETTPETAEGIKYVANALLFTYVSFWNGVAARLAETTAGISMDDLRRGVTADPRISDWGTCVGNGAGGSCFAKDMRSLIHQLERRGAGTDLLRAVVEINERQKTDLLDRAERELGLSFAHKRVALLGLSFKRNTNDLREASALRVIEALLGRGAAAVRTYDPLVGPEVARRALSPDHNPLLAKVTHHGSAQEALRSTDLLFISNDSDEFRSLGPILLRTVRPPYTILDGRRMIGDDEGLSAAGFRCLTVGTSSAGAAGGHRAAGDFEAA